MPPYILQLGHVPPSPHPGLPFIEHLLFSKHPATLFPRIISFNADGTL